MKLEQSFEVAAPIERVWRTLIDVEHVAPCLPGAAVTGRNEDGSYNGTFTVKIGPTTASYTGKLEMEHVDEASHTATMNAQGTDKRGQGGAKATILSRLAPADGQGTRVEVVTDYHITGRLARFGRGGMIEDISERLLREFAKRLQSSLAAQPEAYAPAVAAPAVEPAAAPAEPAAPELGAPETAAARGAAAAEAAAREAAAREAAAREAAAREAAAREAAATEAPAATPERGADTVVSPVPEWTRSEAAAEDVPAQDRPSEAPTQTMSPSSPEPAVTASSEPPAPPTPRGPEPPAVAPPPPTPAAQTPPPPAAQTPPLDNPPMPSEPMQGLSLMGSVVWGRVKRNPAPVAAAGVAVVLLMARRRRRRHGH
jgi:uncharacterized protein